VVRLTVFEPDLLFSSKVESVCAKLGVETRTLTTFQDLRASLSVEPPNVLVINLDSLDDELGSLKDLIQKKPLKTVGYYSHVNAKLAEEARKIGVDLVIPRGAFANKIQDTLSELMRG